MGEFPGQDYIDVKGDYHSGESNEGGGDDGAMGRTLLGGTLQFIGIVRQAFGIGLIGYGVMELNSGAVIPGIHTIGVGGTFVGAGILEEKIGKSISGDNKSCK